MVRYDLTSRTFNPFLPGLSASDVTFSADGKWMAYVSSSDRSLWRSRSDGGERLQLTFPPVAVGGAVISPNGKLVVYESNEGFGIRIVSMDGGTPSNVTNLPASNANWSLDGKLLVFNEVISSWQTPELRVLDVGTGRISQVPGGQMYPEWIAPGKLVAASRDMSLLQIYDLSTGQWSNLSKPDDGPVGNWAHSPDFQYFYYTTKGHDPRIFRVHTPDMKSEVIARVKDIHPVPGSLSYSQITVAPDGSPIFTYEIGTQEIYALSVKWP